MRFLNAVQVFPNASGTITIMQDGIHLCAMSHVVVRPEQVETLIRWLREVKAELEAREAITKGDELLIRQSVSTEQQVLGA